MLATAGTHGAAARQPTWVLQILAAHEMGGQGSPMFVETKPSEQIQAEPWFDRFTRSRPIVFSVVLFLFAALVTVGLLFKSAETVVLYQGF
jgi:hypothetical protein